MSEFLSLIGQILIITCVQMISEIFIDSDKRPHLSKITNAACYAAAVLVVVQFVLENLMQEVLTIVNRMF